MRIIVTRSMPECEQWVARLRAAGMQAQALPLMQLRALPAPWPSAGSDKAGMAPQAVMFVSAAAARFFFADAGLQSLAARARLGSNEARAWVTGPASARALLDAGVARQMIDLPMQDAGELDSEALWQVIAPQLRPGLCVLIVRGRDALSGALGRGWLAQRLLDAGAELAQWIVYERALPAWGESDRMLALQAATDGSRWWLSNSLAIAHLQALLPRQDWRAAQVIAAHSRIALAAREAGFGSVQMQDARLRSMLASIESSDDSGESAAAP